MAKTELEILEEISGKQDITAKEAKEASRAAAEIKAESEKLTLEVKELNEKMAAKDATLGEIQTEVKELKAKTGRLHNTAAIDTIKGLRALIQNSIAAGIVERKDEIKASQDGRMMTPYEIKTVGAIVSANLATDNYISYIDWQPGMEPTGQFHFRNLVRTIMSETDYVQFPRADVPIGEGSFARTTDGSTKPQVDRDYTMVNVTLNAMAAFTIVSRQALRNIIFLQSWLPTSLMNQLEESEDTDFANTLVAAATGSSTATGITVNAEKLIYYTKNLIAAKFNPNGTAMDPTIWASILVTKPNDYSLPGVVVIDPLGNVRVLGRPVYPVNWLTGGRILMGDWTKAAIVQSEGLRLRQSDSHASIFSANEIAFLLERTENLAVFRPDAFITTVLT